MWDQPLPSHSQHTVVKLYTKIVFPSHCNFCRGTSFGRTLDVYRTKTGRIHWAYTGRQWFFKLHPVAENCARVAPPFCHLATLMFTNPAQKRKIVRIWQVSLAVLHLALTKAGHSLPTALDSIFQKQREVESQIWLEGIKKIRHSKKYIKTFQNPIGLKFRYQMVLQVNIYIYI